MRGGGSATKPILGFNLDRSKDAGELKCLVSEAGCPFASGAFLWLPTAVVYCSVLIPPEISASTGQRWQRANATLCSVIDA